MTDTDASWQSSSPQNHAHVQSAAQTMQRLLYEVKRVVVGQDTFLQRVMIALLAQGHLLIEGVLQNLDGSVSVKVDRVEAVHHSAPDVPSHDFH